MTNAIELAGVGKRYQVVEGQPMLLRPGRRRQRELWALRDVDLVVPEGETVGVIGRNGSGKTSLLRLLSGVSAPTVGRLRIRGRIAPLIGIGVGFHPEMTGRENVEVNGQMLGLTAEQVRRRYDAIVDFSEIESFLDTPVKFYSSGMFLRLAFAVAVHTDPQVMLVDEVLAVGDLAFQAKCLERMRQLQEQGTTLVIVTHNLPSLDRMAPRAVVLSAGRVAYDGPVSNALSAYHAALESGEGGAADDVRVRVTAELLHDDGSAGRSFRTGERIRVRVHATFDEDVTAPVLGLMVSPLGLGMTYSINTTPGAYTATHGPGRPLDAEVVLTNRMLDTSYAVHVSIHAPEGRRELGSCEPLVFYVRSDQTTARGFVDLEGEIVMGGQLVSAPPVRRLDGS